MKNIIRRVQSLNERAAELTAVAGQLPQRVAEMRQAMQATASELHTLKSDVETNISDLIVHNDDDIAAALLTVASHAPAFSEAGYLLENLDVEIAPTQRIIVTLKRQKDISLGKLQELIAQYRDPATIGSLLSAIFKARTMMENIELDGLDYDQLIIVIGPQPTIRLRWRDRNTPHSTRPATAASQPTTTPALTPATSSFFSGATLTPLSSLQAKPASPESPATPEKHPVTPPPLPTDPLARFKVMPTVRKP